MSEAIAKPLRIAQIAPLTGPVAPASTGSIEQLVWLLCEELTRQDHEVTLFATGESETSAALHSVYRQGYCDDDGLTDWRFHDTMQIAAACERADAFDVIHSHVYSYALPFTRFVQTPIVHTYHIMPDADIVGAYGRYPEANLTAISRYQRQNMAEIPDVPVIYNGIDIEAFAFRPVPENYALFLGQITPSKGPIQAIQVARRAGVPLVLAGGADREFYRDEVAPLVDGQSVRYVGRVAAAERNRLLGGAAALIYPLQEPEPFGLVMIEAIASGTPVAALGVGAVPEIVENGVSGYHADSVDALVERMPAVLALDRGRVRQAAARFDYRVMVECYLALYRRIVARRPAPDMARG
ncbi:MAG TPA: glycosyltransferase family 4 protein [Chthonomonadaceae bacterium]|nr:glycosyltransferase family 4 protein [Chthonomonadaceae bacterium]